MNHHFENGLHVVEEQFRNFMAGYRMKNNHTGKPMNIGVVFSAGLDSNVLFDVACKYRKMFNYTVTLIYISVEFFGRDNAMVDNLAIKLGNQFRTEIVFDICPVSNYSTAETARGLIQNRLKEVVFNKEFDLVMTGFNADDQLEGVLFNFFRGCEVEELTGSDFLSTWKHKQKTRTLGRPFLNLDNNQLMDYARYNKLFFISGESEFDIDIHDSSFIKSNIIPKIIQQFNRAAIQRTLTNISKYVAERNQPVIDVNIIDGCWCVSEFIRLPIGNRVYVIREHMRQVHKVELSEDTLSILRRRLEEDLTDLFIHIGGYVLLIKDGEIVVESTTGISATA